MGTVNPQHGSTHGWFFYVFLMEVWASGIAHDLKPPKGISWDDFNDGLPSPEIMFFKKIGKSSPAMATRFRLVKL
jgi:hypothetical protein